jgi:hypothetical protein
MHSTMASQEDKQQGLKELYAHVFHSQVQVPHFPIESHDTQRLDLCFQRYIWRFEHSVKFGTVSETLGR